MVDGVHGLLGQAVLLRVLVKEQGAEHVTTLRLNMADTIALAMTLKKNSVLPMYVHKVKLSTINRI